MSNLSKVGGGVVFVELGNTVAWLSDGESTFEAVLGDGGFADGFPEGSLDTLLSPLKSPLEALKAKTVHLALVPDLLRLGHRVLGRVPEREARSALLNELAYSEPDLSENNESIVSSPFRRGEEIGMLWTSLRHSRIAALKAGFSKLGKSVRSIVHPTLSLVGNLEGGDHILMHFTAGILMVVTVTENGEYDVRDLSNELGRTLMGVRGATNPTVMFYSFLADPTLPAYKDVAKMLRLALQDAGSILTSRGSSGPRTLWLCGVGPEDHPAIESLFELMQTDALNLIGKPFPDGEFAVVHSMIPARVKRKLAVNLLKIPLKNSSSPRFLRPVALGVLCLTGVGVAGHYVWQESKLANQRNQITTLQGKIKSLEPYRAFALALKAHNAATLNLLGLPGREAALNPNWRSLIKKLITNIPTSEKNYDVRLDALNIRPLGLGEAALYQDKKPGFVAELSGQATSKAALERFIAHFETASNYAIAVQGINYKGSLFTANVGMVVTNQESVSPDPLATQTQNLGAGLGQTAPASDGKTAGRAQPPSNAQALPSGRAGLPSKKGAPPASPAVSPAKATP